MTLNENFSDLDDEPTPSRSRSQPESTDSLQDLKVGQYVLVNYEDELYPGQITEMRNSDEAMKKSGVYWKWPAEADEIFYSKDEILHVNELGAYNELSSF